MEATQRGAASALHGRTGLAHSRRTSAQSRSSGQLGGETTRTAAWRRASTSRPLDARACQSGRGCRTRLRDDRRWGERGPSCGGARLAAVASRRPPTRRRAAMAQPQRLPLLGSRPGAAEIGAPSHRLQHPRGAAVLPTPPRPANTIGRAVVNAPPQKCRRRRAVPLSDVRRPARLAAKNPDFRLTTRRYGPESHYSPLHPVGPDLACSVAAMNRRPHRPRSSFQPQTGQTTVSPSAISPLAVASRLPSCRE